MALVFHLARRFPGAESARLQGTKWEISLCVAGASRDLLSTVHSDLQCRFICRVAWACLIYMLIQVYLSVPARAQGQTLACYPALRPSPHTSITNLW